MDVPNKICHILRSETLLGVEWGFHSPSWDLDSFSFGVRGVAFEGKVTIRGHKNEVLSQFLLNSICFNTL